MTRRPSTWQLFAAIGFLSSSLCALLGGSPGPAFAWGLSLLAAIVLPRLLLWWSRPKMRVRALRRVLRRHRREAREQAAQAYLAHRRQLLATPGRN